MYTKIRWLQTGGQISSAALTVDSSCGRRLQFPPLPFQNQHRQSSLPLAEAPLRGVLSKTGDLHLTVPFLTSSDPNTVHARYTPQAQINTSLPFGPSPQVWGLPIIPSAGFRGSPFPTLIKNS